MKKRILSGLLSLVMIFALLPVSALAAGDTQEISSVDITLPTLGRTKTFSEYKASVSEDAGCDVETEWRTKDAAGNYAQAVDSNKNPVENKTYGVKLTVRLKSGFSWATHGVTFTVNGQRVYMVYDDEYTYTQEVTAKPTYAVTVDNNSSHGTLTVDKDEAVKGETVTVTATPNANRRLVSVTCTQKNANSTTVPVQDNQTFTMPENDVTLSAVFEPLPRSALTLDTAGSGASVSGNTATVKIGKREWNGTTKVWEGKSVHVTAATVDGYAATVDVKPTDENSTTKIDTTTDNNETTFTMPAESVTVTVTFNEIYKITYSAESEDGNTFTVKKSSDDSDVSPGTAVEAGTKVYVDVTCDDNHTFVVKANENEVPKTADKYEVTVTGPTTITVEFTAVYAVTLAKVDSTEGSFKVTYGNDNIEVKNGEKLPAGTELTIVPTPADRKKLGAVLAGDTEIPAAEDGSYKYKMRAEPVKLTVTFVDDTDATIKINKVENGSVTVTAGGEPINYGSKCAIGTVLTINATPNTDFIVDTVTVNNVEIKPNDDNSYSYAVNKRNQRGDVVIDATFKPIQEITAISCDMVDRPQASFKWPQAFTSEESCYTLSTSWAPEDNPTETVSSELIPEAAADKDYIATITATPKPGYKFADAVTVKLGLHNNPPFTKNNDGTIVFTSEFKVMAAPIVPSIMVKVGETVGKELIPYDNGKTSFVVNTEANVTAVELITNSTKVTKDGSAPVEVSDGKATISLNEAGNVTKLTVDFGDDMIYTVWIVNAAGSDTPQEVTPDTLVEPDKGTATTEITEYAALAEIEKATTGDAKKITVDATATSDADADKVETSIVTIPATVAESLRDKKVAAEIKTDIGTVTLPAKVVTQALTNNATALKLEVAKADTTLDEVTTHGVFTVTVKKVTASAPSGTEVSIANLEKPIVLTFPVPASEDLTNPTLVRVSTEGSETIYTELENVAYDKTSGTISGETDHLSTFAIIEEAEIPAPETPTISVKLPGAAASEVEFDNQNTATLDPVASTVSSIDITVTGGQNVTVSKTNSAGGTIEYTPTNGTANVTLMPGENVITVTVDGTAYTIKVIKKTSGSSTTVKPTFTFRSAEEMTAAERNQYYCDSSGGVLTITGLDPEKTYMLTMDNGLVSGGSIPRTVMKVTPKEDGTFTTGCQWFIKIIVFTMDNPNGEVSLKNIVRNYDFTYFMTSTNVGTQVGKNPNPNPN